MTPNSKYGYKVCYTELGKSRMKLYLITNTLDSALWSIRWYEISGGKHAEFTDKFKTAGNNQSLS